LGDKQKSLRINQLTFTNGDKTMNTVMNTVSAMPTATMTPVTTTGEGDVLTARTKATWMAGDFGKIAKTYAPGAAEFVGRLNVGMGDNVLDVACGTGNLSIPAARTGAQVTGIDIAPNLLEQAREWAHMEGLLRVRFDEGDAERMPYGAGEFDMVVTMFGAMFAARPELAAAELVRVTRSGGTIAMANWMPDGFIGQMFKITGRHVPPAPGIPSPLQWGVEATVAERLGSEIAELRCTPRPITFNFPFDPATTVEYFRQFYGPTQRAFAAVAPDAQQALRHDLEEHWAKHNYGKPGTTQVDSTYLEVIAIRK
jgi:SAM-dependent methyltransferase